MSTNVIERFIGRDAEIQAFREILALDKQEARVFFLQGPGGIGKTWLLRRYLEIAEERQNVLAGIDLIDMYSTNNRYIDGVIASIIQQLPETEIPKEYFQAYKSAVQNYEQIRSGKFDNVEDIQTTYDIEDQMSLTERIEYRLLAMREAFQDIIREVCKKQSIVLAFDTFENVQNGPVGKWLLSSDGLNIPGVICLIASRLKPIEDSFETNYLRYWPVSKLSDEEAIELYYKYTNSQEPRTEKLKRYINSLNSRTDGNPLLFGLATLWLTVSQRDIDEQEIDTQEEFEEAIVSWLNPLSGRGSYHLGGVKFDDPMRQVLVFMAYLNRRFNKYFLEKLVKNRFVSLGEISMDELWHKLSSHQPEFFYVKGRPEGEIQLHDKLAEMLRRYLFASSFDDLSGVRQQQFASQVVNWYDELISSGENDIDEEDAHIQVLRAEKLAYVLRLDVLSDWLSHKNSRQTEKLHRLLPAQYQQTVNLLKEYQLLPLSLLGRLVVNDMRLPIVQEFPEQLRYECASLMGEIALLAYQPEDAVVYWEEAGHVAARRENVKEQIIALLGQNKGLFQTKTRDSVNVLETALELTSQVPELEVEILYEMGYVHRRLEDIDSAIQYYEMALEKAIQNKDRVWLPSILNDLGYALTFKGEFAPEYNHEALRLRSVNLANAERKVASLEESIVNAKPERKFELQTELARIRKLVRNRKWEIGLTYNTLGQLYRFNNDLPNATAEYSQALTIFQEIDNKKWEAEALYSRGEAYRRLAVGYFELGRETPCLEHDERSYRDTDASVDICERYNFIDKLATAYRRKGRLYHDRYFRAELTGFSERYWLDKSLDLFDKGYKIAHKHHLALEEFENLTEKAFLGDDLIAHVKKHSPSQLVIEIQKAKDNLNLLHDLIEEHGKSDIKIYQYPVFIHLAELEDGALWLVQEEYDLALKKFLDGFSGLARTPGYGHARLKQHTPLLLRILRDLDNEDRQVEWCDAFRDIWQQRGEDGTALINTQPDLLNRVNLFQRTRFMYGR